VTGWLARADNLYVHPVTLSVVIPCYNEATLEDCVNGVLSIEDDTLALEVIIVDDGSTDGSLQVAERLANCVPGIVVLRHERNQGKGAALRTGLKAASGAFVAIQDADLEYDPADLKRLLIREAAGLVGEVPRLLRGEAL